MRLPSLLGWALLLCGCASSAGGGDQSGCDTSVSGVVTAPNGTDPIPGATVFVAGTPPPPLGPGVRCQPCAAAGGEPIDALYSTTSAPDGSFTLHGLPKSSDGPLTLYIQKGLWRRQLPVQTTACLETHLGSGDAHLPRSQAEGELPTMAVAVGDFDAIECVLRHIGIAPSEFTAPNGPGAVHLYENEQQSKGGAPGGVTIDGLLLDPRALARHQMLLLNCTDTGGIAPYVRDPDMMQNLLDYVGQGGRLYTTDWTYNFVAQQPAWSPYLCFEDGGPCGVPGTHAFQGAAVGLPLPFPAAVPASPSGAPADYQTRGLADWLRLPQFGLPDGQVEVSALLLNWVLMRPPPDSAQSRYPALTWLHGQTNGADRPLTMSFDYPPAPQGMTCGRVLYSSQHTRGHLAPGAAFPAYCPAAGQDILPQERVLEYLLFEVSTCVPAPG